MSAEAFQLLCRGGAAFNKSSSEVRLFKGKVKPETDDKTPTAPGQLPIGLDFFRYAQNNTVKRKAEGKQDHAREKKRKTEQAESWGNLKDLGTHDLHRRMAQRVTVKGANAPPPIDSLDDLKQYSIPSNLYVNLARSGYQDPTGIQSYCIPVLLHNRDLVAISPTGTGKTLAYLLPVFAMLVAPAGGSNVDAGVGCRAVIIVPTRELAHQIHNECLKLAQGKKWKVVLLSKATANTLTHKEARDKVDIIISTPLRLLAVLRAGNLDLVNVRHLILDEADRLLDKEFFDQIQEIVNACTHARLQKAVLTATLPANAEEMAMDMLQNPIRVVVGLKDTPLPLIHQSVTYVADDASKLPSLLAYFVQPYNPPVLIFTSTQVRATSLAEELILNNIPNADCLHAGMTQKEREESVGRMRSGKSWVMVTTEVMARGIDFKGVREVINYDFPKTIQSYVHRIGRTGRAGREGKAITFFTDEDAPYLKMIANVILQSGFTVPDWILELPKPSKMKRKQMGRVKRPETINPARLVGRRDAIKKRDMVLGSKRRTAKALRRHDDLDRC